MRELTRSVIITAWIGAIGWLGAATRAEAQVKSTVAAALATNTGQTSETAASNSEPSGTASSNSELLPADRQEIADEERLSWSLKKFPSQKYMNEIYWQFPSDTPAFFRDSLLQFVSRTYEFTRDNFDGSKSQAWAAGGWVAFRSGLLGDMFGVHAAYYFSQPLFAPDDESGTKLLNPQQEPLSMLGQLYGRMQVRDQELRGGMQLVDTPLINPQDNRMVPNTFDGTTVVSLPDKDRNYDYAVGYLWDVKQRDFERFHSDVRCAGRHRCRKPRSDVRDGQIPAVFRIVDHIHGLLYRRFREYGVRSSRVRLSATEECSKLDCRREHHRASKYRKRSANRKLLLDLSGLCQGADDV